MRWRRKNSLVKSAIDCELLKSSLKQQEMQALSFFSSFGTNLLLKSHEQSTHGLSASWVCDVCAKGFAMKSALEFHRQQHSQEGRAALKAQCEHCKIWLKNIKSLRSHVKRCKSEPVPCDVCGKECSNAMSLRSHKKFVHTNATTYSCSFCAKPFKRLLRLKVCAICLHFATFKLMYSKLAGTRSWTHRRAAVQMRVLSSDLQFQLEYVHPQEGGASGAVGREDVSAAPAVDSVL